MSALTSFVPNPLGDTELWQVVDRMWAFPMWLHWGTIDGVDYAEIVPAVPLTYEQSATLALRLKIITHIKLASGFAVSPNGLRNVARRCPGITPSKYFIWKAAVGRAFEGPRTEPGKDAFVEHLATHCSPDVDAASVTMVWITLCNLIPEWLLAGKDINFADNFTLRALPLRKNWRQILIARVPSLRKVYMTRKATELLRAFFTTAASWLRSPELMDVVWRFGSTTGVVYKWNIFLQQGKAWDDVVYDQEIAALNAVGPQDYILRWSHIIGKHEDIIHQMGIDDLSKENAASGRVVASRGNDSARLVRNLAVTLSHPKIVWSSDDGITSIDDFANDPKSVEIMEKAAARLLSLSSPVPPPMDVRSR